MLHCFFAGHLHAYYFYLMINNILNQKINLGNLYTIPELNFDLTHLKNIFYASKNIFIAFFIIFLISILEFLIGSTRKVCVQENHFL